MSFGWSNPAAALASGKWLAGGLSVSSPTHNDGTVDLGYEFYAWTDSSDSIGVAWFIVAACEWPPDCGSGPYSYSILASNYATIQGHASDQITLVVYWNTNYNEFIFDYKDPGCSSCGNYYWTVEDFVPPTYASDNFYYGIDTSCPAMGFPCNPPYNNSYGSQLGVTSNQQGLSNTYWEVLFSNPSYVASGTTYYPQHALTMGGGIGEVGNGVATGDAYWHDNWDWGGMLPEFAFGVLDR
ncbi:MAG TPA: hypothetical protein VGR56_05855 [Nitrososphaerales archaeon]|nr:hypothetical protein [Nitrososphaerales archaeon]